MNAKTASHDSSSKDQQTRRQESPTNGRRLRFLNWGSMAVIVICLIVLTRLLPIDQAILKLQNTIDGLGVWGPLIFAIAYIVAGLLFVPGAALTIAAGAVFGLLMGTVVVSFASTLTAGCAFLIARYLARGSVQKMAQQNARFSAIDRAIGRGGWRIVALLRLSPAVPFSIGNYLYGLTSIRFGSYVLASWVCMLPGTFMYVYIGHIGAAGLQAAGSASSVDTGKTVLLVAGLMATVVVTIYITRLARQALAEQSTIEENDMSSDQEPVGNDVAPGGAAWKSWALPGLAALMIVGTAVACLQKDKISGLFGPPTVTLQETFQSSDDGPVFDHTVFDRLVKKHVSDAGWVDYKALKNVSLQLDAYIAALAEAPYDKLGRDQKLTLLINAYNAFTLRLILDYYPLQSIKDIPSDKRWDDQRWQVGGYQWSLNQIEHQQIRPNFKEPRIHFALVCAAAGCPPLRNEAYVAHRLDQQLADQTEYVHTHDRWLRLDREKKVIHLTKLYSWYGGDFKQVSGSVLAYVADHVLQLKQMIEQGDTLKIEWIDYDWSLNSKERMP